MDLVIANNLRLSGAPLPLKLEITKALTITNPEYIKRKQRKQRVWGIEPKLKLYAEDMGSLVIPRGFLHTLTAMVVGQGVNIQDYRVQGHKIDFGVWHENYTIREAQKPCVEAIVKDNGILVAPAGSGKTIMGLRAVYEKSVPALWITHTIDLLDQTTQRALSCMPNIGKIGKIAQGVCDWGDGKLIVATYQTLMNNPKIIAQLNQFIGTVVVDESQHAPSECFADVINKLSAQYVLGLTATPDRKDGLEAIMYASIGPKLYAIDRGELYMQNRLIKPKIEFVYTDFEYDTACSVSDCGAVDAGGEEIVYHELMQAVTSDLERMRLIAENVAKQQGYQLVISDSIAYCHNLAYAIQCCCKDHNLNKRIAIVHGTLQRNKWVVAPSAKVAQLKVELGEALAYKWDAKARRYKMQVEQYDQATFADWGISTAQRKQIMQDAANKKIDILIATGQLIQEGVDLPHLNHGHLVTPKRGDAGGKSNGISVEQAIGRIMRPDPQKPNKPAIWWDYVDYRVGIFKNQYSSRRKVYERLGLQVPAKPRTKRENTIDFLNSLRF